MNEQSSVAASLDASKNARGAEGGRARRASFLPPLALLVLAYTTAGIAGLQFAMVSGAASPIWPAAGIALACVLHAGRRVWPGIVVAVLAAYQLTGADIPLWVQLVTAFGNAAAAVLGAEVITRFGGARFRELATLRSILLLLVASIVAAGVAAAIGPTALLLAGKLSANAAWDVYEGWFIGDAVGILLVASLIVSWRSSEREDWQPGRLFHLLVVLAATGVLSGLIFFLSSGSRAWSIYPALVWAALALRVRGTAAALVLATVVASAATLRGFGPFASGGAPDLVLLQQYLAVTCATCLLLAGAVDERNAEVQLREAAAKEREARNELQRAETMLELIGASAPIALYAKDVEGRYLYANAVVAAATGTADGQLVGKTDMDWAAPDVAATLTANDAVAMTSGEVNDTEESIFHPDGERRTYRALKAPLRDRSGEIIGLVGVSTDITEQKRVAEQLTRMAERAEIAQQAARSSLYEYDPSSNTATRDPLIRELLGYSADELPADHDAWERLIHRDDLPQFRQTVRKSLDRAERFAMEYRVFRKDGSIMWIADVGRIVRDDRGTPQRIVGMATDVTERKEAEEELRRTNSLLQLIGDSAGGMIFAKDRQGRYIYANQHVSQITSRGSDELIGRDDTSWAKPELARLYMDNDRRIMEAGVAEEVDEEALLPDGSRRLYRSLKAPLRNTAGEVIGIVGVATDITSRKAAEEREQLLAREVDHRAKNLLAVVQSVVQMSRAEDIDSFKAGVTGRIQSLARAHSLLAQGRWEGVGLEQIVAEELAAFRVDGQDRIRIEGPPLRLTPAAAQSLALVLHELATNAAKYGALSRDGGAVKVGWAREEDGSASLQWCELSGVATAPPTRSGFGGRLIQASVQRQLRGTLAYHWGENGLTVRLTIPAEHLLRAAAEPAATAANAGPPPGEPMVRPTSCRILIVEDEALIGLQLEQALVEQGCEVVGVASNVTEALQLIDDKQPEGALLDINLAGEKSFPVAERLASLGVPFVFCTGYAGEQVLPPSLADAPLIRKPFDAASVVSLVLKRDAGEVAGRGSAG